MNFTSEIFIFFFLPITLIFYHLIRQRSVPRALGFLSAASLVFYAWEEPSYIFIILFSTMIDWVVSNKMIEVENKRVKLSLLLVSLISNLGLLAFFKYSGFVAENLGGLGSVLGIELIPPDTRRFLSGIVLPVGISFYTFQTLSYTIDIYERRITRARSFTEFLCFVTCFPQLVAGPIVRYSDIQEQLKKPVVNRRDVQEGIFFIVLGLSKKILVADSLAGFVEYIFDVAKLQYGLTYVIGAIAYALQLYFDFSGYSEMAVGLGRILGFHFPQNFNSPYKASSISDFWRRWHMSLSFWFRDYVYIMLGGSRCSELRANFNRLLTMTLCGLWHGAGWNYVFWGAAHGCALVGDKFLQRFDNKAVAVLRKAAGLLIVILLWIPFRAKHPYILTHIFNQLTSSFYGPKFIQEFNNLPNPMANLALIIIAALAALFGRNVYEMNKEITAWKAAGLTLLMILSIYFILSRDYIPFLYYQF